MPIAFGQNVIWKAHGVPHSNDAAFPTMHQVEEKIGYMGDIMEQFVLAYFVFLLSNDSFSALCLFFRGLPFSYFIVP